MMFMMIRLDIFDPDATMCRSHRTLLCSELSALRGRVDMLQHDTLCRCTRSLFGTELRVLREVTQKVSDLFTCYMTRVVSLLIRSIRCPLVVIETHPPF